MKNFVNYCELFYTSSLWNTEIPITTSSFVNYFSLHCCFVLGLSVVKNKKQKLLPRYLHTTLNKRCARTAKMDTPPVPYIERKCVLILTASNAEIILPVFVYFILLPFLRNIYYLQISNQQSVAIGERTVHDIIFVSGTKILTFLCMGIETLPFQSRDTKIKFGTIGHTRGR